jgi:hypothetical protein
MFTALPEANESRPARERASSPVTPSLEILSRDSPLEATADVTQR